MCTIGIEHAQKLLHYGCVSLVFIGYFVHHLPEYIGKEFWVKGMVSFLIFLCHWIQESPYMPKSAIPFIFGLDIQIDQVL